MKKLSDKQHNIIYSIVEKLDWFYKRQRYQECRPDIQISEIPTEDTEKRKLYIKKWWKWVIHHYHEPIKKYHSRMTPKFLSERCKQITKYAEIVKLLLKKETLDDVMKETRRDIESQLNYEECKLIIYATIDKELKPTGENDSKEGWGSWMMRGGGLFRGRSNR